MPYFLFILLLYIATSNAHTNAFGISELKPNETWLEVELSSEDHTEKAFYDLYGRSSTYRSPGINYIDHTKTPIFVDKQSLTIARAFSKQIDDKYTPIIGLTYQKFKQETGYPNFSFTDYYYVKTSTYLTKLIVGSSFSNDSNRNISSFLFTQQSSNTLTERNQSGIEFGIRNKDLFDIADNKLNIMAAYFEKNTNTSGGHSLFIKNTSLFNINQFLKWDVNASLGYKSKEDYQEIYYGIIYTADLADPEILLDENGNNVYEELNGGEPQLIESEYSIKYDYIYSYGVSIYFQPIQNISFRLSANKNQAKGTRDQSGKFNIDEEIIGFSLVSFF